MAMNDVETSPRAQQELALDLRREADRCVKCGLCLPECPTYRLTLDEAESPRGRIALIDGVASGSLRPNRRFDQHLDNCLLCRRCERVCPSGVRYGALMDQARTLTRQRRPGWLRWTAEVLVRPVALRPLLQVGRLTPRGNHLAGRFAALARAGDRRAPPKPGSYPPAAVRRGRVGLFLGCVGRFTQAETLHAAIRLLQRLGYEVVVPADQGCCGALHAHLGDAARAAALAQENCSAFELGLDVIVSVATGCGAQLADAPEYRGRLPSPHLDINAFLAEQPLGELSWRPLPERVLVHTPCSQLNVLRSADSVGRILRHIPLLEIEDLPDNDACCGAAGSYLLSHPDTARRLREPKLAAAVRSTPHWLVTSNPGCALHLADGLRAAGRPLPVVHPVQLLERQSDAAPNG